MENFSDQIEANKHTIRLLLDYLKRGKENGAGLRLINSRLVQDTTIQNEESAG